MKGKKKIVYFLLAVLGIFLFGIDNVYAAEKVKISFDYQSNVYYTRKGDGLNDSHQYLYYTLNGIPAFCIEPGVQIDDWDYLVYGIERSPFDAEKTHRMQLIGHYGYDYPGHQTQKYRMATQKLIWETSKDIKVEYYTKVNGGGTHIDISEEVNEILRLVDNHYKKPSFNGTTINVTYNNQVVIDDANSILSDYEVYDDGGNVISISDNKLYITPKKMANTSIVLKKKLYDNATTIIYIGENGRSQKLGRFRATDPVLANINLNTTGGTVSISKQDADTNSNNPQGNAKLSGAQYGVYDESDNLITTITTNEAGKGTSELLNRIGRFYLQEIVSPEGYLLNDNKYYFEITEDNLNKTVVVKDNVIKGNIKITKIDSETNQCESQGEATLVGAKFEIKDKNNKVVDTLTIGEDCTARSKELPYGDYIINEKQSSKGYYRNDNTFNSSIRENKDYNITVKEDIIKNSFQFYKFYGNENTGFIYAEPNASFSVLNSDGDVYTYFITDSNGYATINLPYGKYIVVQETGLDDYKLMYDFPIEVNEITNLTQTHYLKNGEITAKLKLVKIDSETKEVINISGFKFKIKNVNTNEYVCQTTDKVICEFETNDEGVLLTPLPLFGGDYEIEEISSKPNYLLSDEKISFSIKNNTELINDPIYGSLIELKFENQRVKGEIIIHKVVEKANIVENGFEYTDERLDGIKFCLYNENKEEIKCDNTNKEGELIFNNLELGKYYLKEVETLDDYVLDSKEHEIVLKYKDQKTPIITYETLLKNKLKKGNLEFTKTDFSESKTLPNTLIEIYTDNNKLVFTKRTDKNGKIIINEIPKGKYYILEKEAPEGYVLNEEKMYFEIKENGEVVKANMKDEEIKGTLEFTKTDISESEPLPDTLIEIYNSLTDDIVFSGRTNLDGKITIKDLYYGKYYILEKEAPEGYALNEERMYFEIKENGEVVKATMKDEEITGSLDFTKTDISDDSPLPNTLIEIYTENDELLFSKRTDENGKVIIMNLKYGKYYILEKEAPDGYELNEEKMYFEIKENGEVVKANMKDEKIIKVPNTEDNDLKELIITGTSLMILGVLLIIYGKKKKNK